MGANITDIDHLMLCVADSARAGAMFEKMGFTITPRGQLPGMSNRLICFSDGKADTPNFVELMSLDSPEEAPPPMAEALRIPDRPVLIVAASGDAEATRKGLEGVGLEAAPVLDSGRIWTLPDGEIVELSFRIVLPDPGQAPFYWIVCEHKTPRQYLRPGFVNHPNKSRALTKVIGVASDPARAATHFGRSWGMPVYLPVHSRGETRELAIVSGKRVELHIFGPKGLAEAFPGLSITRPEDHIVGFAVRVENLDTIETELTKNGFNPMVAGDNLMVEPEQACGCLVVFEPGGNRPA